VCSRDETWFSELATVQGNISQLLDRLQSLSSYSWGPACDPYDRDCLPGQIQHGDYCSGINKDSYVRPWFEASYTFAFVGSVEWVYNLEKWATQAGGAAFLNEARNYVPVNQTEIDELAFAVKSSEIVSYATTTVFGENDGHWKGAGSGEIAEFVTGAAEWIGKTNFYKSLYTQKNSIRPSRTQSFTMLIPVLTRKYPMRGL